MIPATHVPPPRPFRTGVHDAAASPDNVPAGELPANIIRRIWYQGNPDNQIKTWCQDMVNGGGYPMPCMDTQTYGEGNGYAQRLGGLLDTNPNCDYVELGNEPQEAGTQGSVLNRHLDFIAAGAPAVHARGYRTILTHQLNDTGGFATVANALDAGTRGATWDHIDAVAYHQYPAEPSDVINSLNSFRDQIDSHAGAKGKALILNETGWPAATRNNGSGNPADWAGSGSFPPTHTGGVPWWHQGATSVERVISLTEQGNKVTSTANTGIGDLLDVPATTNPLRMLGFCWFCYEDYPTYPTGDAYGHCGLLDNGGAERPALTKFAALNRFLSVHHFHLPPVAPAKRLTLTQTGGSPGTVTVTAPYGFSTTAGGVIDAQTGATIVLTRSGSPNFFLRWEKDGVPAGTATTLSVAMAANHTITVVRQ